MNKNLLVIIGVLIVVNLWFAVNYNFREGLIYTGLAVGTLAFFFIFKETKAGEVIKVALTGTSGLLGIGLGAAFVLINVLGSKIVIGIPDVQSFSTAAGIATVGLVYPIGEEVFFKYGVYGFFAKLAKLTPFLAILLSSVGFMLYHFLAYGGDLYLSSGLLAGAFLFSFASFYVNKWAGSIIPSIIGHVIFNLYLVLVSAQVI